MFDDVRLWTCGHARMLKEKFSNSQQSCELESYLPIKSSGLKSDPHTGAGFKGFEAKI